VPITADERLLDALQDVRFSANTPSGGLACPVCLAIIAYEGGADGSCEHLLAQGLDGAGDSRSCWTARRPHHFIVQLAHDPEDRFLIREDWVPVKTDQSDRGGCSWIGWFAFPASMFSVPGKPEEVVQRRIGVMEAHLQGLEPGDDTDDDMDDDEAG